MIQTVDLMAPIVDEKHIHGSSIGENYILVHGSADSKPPEQWFGQTKSGPHLYGTGHIGKLYRRGSGHFNSSFNSMLLSRSLCKNKKNIIRKSTNIHVSFSCSNIYYINDNLDKRTWTYIFGACCATTVFIPSFHNYRIWSFLGLLMTTFTAWYLTIASLTHGQVLDFFYNLCRSQKS